MTVLHKAVTAGACALALTAAFAFGAATPSQAASPGKIMHQMHHAAKLDRKAAHAAMMGHPMKAARMRAHAARLRTKAVNGH